MSRCLKAAIGLTAVLFLAVTLTPGLVMAGVGTPEPLLLAQQSQPEKIQAPGPESVLKKPETPKAAAPPQAQPEQMQKKIRSMGPMEDEPAKAGTKKIGGQTIRAKDTPKGE
ncbi:MAG: hypothetical protein ACYDEQ_05975 [Desulfocucumaceae bacterium]